MINTYDTLWQIQDPSQLARAIQCKLNEIESDPLS